MYEEDGAQRKAKFWKLDYETVQEMLPTLRREKKKLILL
jgi:hypothetical protein